MNYLNLKNGKVAYKDLGSGPVVLFGHSYLWSSAMWDKVISVMSQDYRCIVPDLPGHGESELPLPFDLKDLAGFHGELMEQLDIESYYLAGLSIGAMWGSHLVAEYPERIKKFAIINSSLLPEPQETEALYKGMLQAVDMAGVMPPAILDAVVPGFFSEKTDDMMKSEYRKTLEGYAPQQIPQITACGRAFINRGDILSQLKGLDTQFLFIAGRRDLYRPAEESEKGAEFLNSDLHYLDCGHISAEEMPLELSAELKGFFKS